MLKNLTFLTLLLLLVLPACRETHRSLESQLHDVATRHELMGMSVLLIEDGVISEEYHFGKANETSGLANGPDITYRIASISKTVTAIAVMQLWEAGKIDLDVDVSDYLGWTLRNPNFSDEVITLRHLMNHVSGLRDGTGYGSFLGKMKEDQLDIRELFHVDGLHVTDDMFSDQPPGAYFSYTNCTWGLVATVIEKVSGMRFDRYCKSRILDPLGLDGSFNIMDLKIDKIGTIYRAEEDQWVAQVDDYSDTKPEERAYPGYVPGTNGLIYGPQGNLRASARDLGQLARMLLGNGTLDNEQILQPGTFTYMLKDPWTYQNENGDTWDNFWFGYGLGLQRIGNHEKGDIIFPDRPMIGHPGIAYGLLSDMYFDPVTQSGVVFVTNGSKKDFSYAESSSFYQVEADVFELLFEQLMQ